MNNDSPVLIVLWLIVLGIIIFIQYKIATSDIDPWLKFWLLR